MSTFGLGKRFMATLLASVRSRAKHWAHAAATINRASPLGASMPPLLSGAAYFKQTTNARNSPHCAAMLKLLDPN
ncbi:MAG TPA: hypothetical protein VJR89_04560 [Polyangiales bacterium]|nr:hypothetical protein [Polyangiales bacterium]